MEVNVGQEGVWMLDNGWHVPKAPLPHTSCYIEMLQCECGCGTCRPQSRTDPAQAAREHRTEHRQPHARTPLSSNTIRTTRSHPQNAPRKPIHIHSLTLSPTEPDTETDSHTHLWSLAAFFLRLFSMNLSSLPPSCKCV